MSPRFRIEMMMMMMMLLMADDSAEDADNIEQRIRNKSGYKVE